jgi:glutamate synthase domain-containing protein 1
MCGIVGLFSKAPEMEDSLGLHLAAMVTQMSDRGPDSAGVAVYRDAAPSGWSKLTLFSADALEDWNALADELRQVFGGSADPSVRSSHAVLLVEAEAAEAEAWVRRTHPNLRVMSAGQAIEIYKETGRPEEFVRQFALTDFQGTHALGHTRMATESRVTTEGSHPFSTGLDLCLVHNGSLSNHNRLRERLRREGIDFQTEEALEGCLHDLDGFYTFLVGTVDGFAVLRDPIACKPAVIAETDDWVAMASEWRAISVLPGAAEAREWEPVPGVVYAWERTKV